MKSASHTLAPLMAPRRSLLDFDGRRLQGVRPFAQFEIEAESWSYRSLPQTDGSNPPFPVASPCPVAARRPVAPQSGRSDPLAALQHLLQQAREQCGTCGAAIGYFSYDFARQLEPVAFFPSNHPASADASPRLPDARLVFYERLETGPSARPDASRHQPERCPIEISTPLPDDYRQAVARIKAYIEAGDIYQANLIRYFELPLHLPPGELYEKLGRLHPARFAAYLEWDDFAIVSNSPERFLKLEGRTLTAEPIKGTIARGRNAAEDERLMQVLQHSIKDRAENVMIVDLLRNDLGRVCEWGSVHVPELWKVQTLPTLHHLVSIVTGTLRVDFDAVDAFRAAFPCGSITGAPKIRAMQIIDALEPVRRGISMGAIGYFGFNGDMDWNVAIRTITCRDGTASFHTGGGLVVDSVAEAEWEELQLKAGALLAALTDATPNTTESI